MIGATKESVNALINSPIKNYPEMAEASTSAACSSSALNESDLEVPPPTPVKNFGNRQKIQRRRNNSEEDRHYASDDERSSADDDDSNQYHPQRSAKKQDLAKKAKLLKRLRSLGLAPRRHYHDHTPKPTKKRNLRKSFKKSPAKTEAVEEQDPLFRRPKFLQCEFCEKDYLTNFMLKRHMAKHLAVRKWSISKATTEHSLLLRRVNLDLKRPKIWGMVFGRVSGVM